MVRISTHNPACSHPGAGLWQPHTATSPLGTLLHCVTSPVQMAFAGTLGALPAHPSPTFLCLSHSASSSSCLFLCPQMSPGVHHLATRCHLPLLTGMQRSLLLVAHSNPYPVAPGIFEDPSPLFLEIIPLPPCCSHWSFTADVKEGKLRTVIVFVGGNLVTAFSFSSRQQLSVWGLQQPARSWGQEALAGMDQTTEKVVECLAFSLNPVNPSKIKAVKEKSPK